MYGSPVINTKGHWTDDVIDGKGVYTFASGMTLDGSFSEGEFVSGAYSMWNDDGTFEFDLEDGILVSVQMELTNGLQYDGGLSQNTLDGEGKIVLSLWGNIRRRVFRGKARW